MRDEQQPDTAPESPFRHSREAAHAHKGSSSPAQPPVLGLAGAQRDTGAARPSPWSPRPEAPSGEPATPGAVHPGVLRQFESSFGEDFSSVRIERGLPASDRRNGVRGVAEPERIRIDPATLDDQHGPGKEVLAEEFAHIAQKRRGTVVPDTADCMETSELAGFHASAQESSAREDLEDEAKRAAGAAVMGRSAQIASGARAPLRQFNFIQDTLGSVTRPARRLAGRAIDTAKDAAEVSGTLGRIATTPNRLAMRPIDAALHGKSPLEAMRPGNIAKDELSYLSTHGVAPAARLGKTTKGLMEAQANLPGSPVQAPYQLLRAGADLAAGRNPLTNLNPFARVREQESYWSNTISGLTAPEVPGMGRLQDSLQQRRTDLKKAGLQPDNTGIYDSDDAVRTVYGNKHNRAQIEAMSKRYGLPPALLSGVVASEQDFDHGANDVAQDALGRRGVPSGDGAGIASVHTDTLQTAISYLNSHHLPGSKQALAYDQGIRNRSSFDGSVEAAAISTAMYMNGKGGADSPQDMAVIWGAYRNGVEGVSPPQPPGSDYGYSLKGYRQNQANGAPADPRFQMGKNAYMSEPYFDYFQTLYRRQGADH